MLLASLVLLAQSCVIDDAPAKVAAMVSQAGNGCLASRVDYGITGAWFRKVMSLPDSNVHGLETRGVLPKVITDPSRFRVGPDGTDDWRTGPLDHPSVYLGGNAAGHEIDAGFSWDRVHDEEGRACYTDLPSGSDGRDPAHRFVRTVEDGQAVVKDGEGQVVALGGEVEGFMAGLTPDFAFRPFWRTSQPNTWHNPPLGPADVYLYPGEPFAMTIQEEGRDELRLDLRALDVPEVTFQELHIPEPGFGRGNAATWKRVSSIDQSGNENGWVIPTRTTALDGQWTSVTRLGQDGAPLGPLSCGNAVTVMAKDTAPVYDQVFRRTALDAKGGETLDIVPISP